MRRLIGPVVLLFGCSDVPPTQPPAPTETAPISVQATAIATSSASTYAHVIATFKLGWQQTRDNLKPELKEWGAGVDALVQSKDPPLRIKMEQCRERLAFLKKNIGAMLDKLVLAGEVKNLDRDGTCPTVFVAGGMKREVEFILDEHGSVVLLAWLVPEG